MEKNRVSFEVLVYGSSTKEYQHEGRTFVEGRIGSEFTLRVRNNTYQKVLAVVTVDGLSVIDGKAGDYKSGGYVLQPYGYIDIPGWRLNNEKVAHFFFSKKSEAYATLVDKPTNIGVIGCAVFRERTSINFRTFLSDEMPVLRDSQIRGGTLGSEKAGNIGTGFGRQASHTVVEVKFNREPMPFALFEIHYDDYDGLKARGVNLRAQPQISMPNAFPGEHGCTPPPGWRG